MNKKKCKRLRKKCINFPGLFKHYEKINIYLKKGKKCDFKCLGYFYVLGYFFLRIRKKRKLYGNNLRLLIN